MRSFRCVHGVNVAKMVLLLSDCRAVSRQNADDCSFDDSNDDDRGAVRELCRLFKLCSADRDRDSLKGRVLTGIYHTIW